jgi:hypothetical protein
MNIETFRVDFLRLPFLVLGLAVAAYAVYAASTAGPLVLIVPFAVLAVGAPVYWHFGVVQVSESGFVLYRTNRALWEEVAGVKRLSFLGLPYLLVRRTSGLPWFVPLYVIGARSLVESLIARAPSGTEFATALGRFASTFPPGGERVA